MQGREPHMEKYYKEYQESENVEIIAVNMTTTERRGLSSIEDFIDAYGLNFLIPVDKDGKVTNAFKANSPPTTYTINTDGTIASKVIGPVDDTKLKELVDNL